MEVKTDRRYGEHVWAKDNEDGTWTIGITEWLNEYLGEIDSVDFNVDVDDPVSCGTKIGHIFGENNSSELISPVEGVVTSINAEVEINPEAMNDDVWEDAWLLIIKAENENSHDTSSAEEYAETYDGELVSE